jgi:hypothetical protein
MKERHIVTGILLCLAVAPTVRGGELGTLVFEDRFERSESQELEDEPGNE